MESSKALEGSVALVTGASSGIGEATARTLAAEGASLIPEYLNSWPIVWEGKAREQG